MVRRHAAGHRKHDRRRTGAEDCGRDRAALAVDKERVSVTVTDLRSSAAERIEAVADNLADAEEEEHILLDAEVACWRS